MHARRLVDAGLAERPLALAENRLVVAVREDAPWQTVGELAAAGVRVVVGAPNVPVGALTESALESLDPSVATWVREHVVTQDPTVRVVLSRVELGEAEAAFVYHTDLAAAPALRAIALPGAPNNEYVAVLVPGDGGVDERAAAFLAFLDSDEARGAAGRCRVPSHELGTVSVSERVRRLWVVAPVAFGLFFVAAMIGLILARAQRRRRGRGVALEHDVAGAAALRRHRDGDACAVDSAWDAARLPARPQWVELTGWRRRCWTCRWCCRRRSRASRC